MSIDLGNTPVGTAPTTNEKLQIRKAIGVNDSNGKLPAEQLPESADIRLSVLGGGLSLVSSVSLAENEIIVDTDYPRIGVGDAEGQLRFLKEGTDLVGLMRSYNGLGHAASKRAAWFVITSAAPTSITVKTTTGYARGIRWDGTLSSVVSGGGVAATGFTVNYSTAMASPFDVFGLPKLIGIVPCDVAGTPSTTANITYIALNSGYYVTGIRVRGLIGLDALDISYSSIEHLDLNGCSALTNLNLTSVVKLSYLDLTPCPSLARLDVDSCESLEHITFGESSSLTNFSASNTKLHNISLLGKTSLTNFTAASCLDLESVNLSGCTALLSVDCQNSTALASVNLTGCSALITLTLSSTSIVELDLTSSTSITSLFLVSVSLLDTLIFPATLSLLSSFLISQSVISGVLAFPNTPNLNVLSIYDCDLLTGITFAGLGQTFQTDIYNNNLLSSLIMTGYDGAFYSGEVSTTTVSYYTANLTNNALTTDAVYLLLQNAVNCEVAYATSLDIANNPACPSASLIDGATYTAAATAALAGTKGYTLLL